MKFSIGGNFIDFKWHEHRMTLYHNKPTCCVDDKCSMVEEVITEKDYEHILYFKLSEIRAEQQRKYRGDADWKSGSKVASTVSSSSKSSSTAASGSSAASSAAWGTVPSSSATNYWTQPDTGSPSPGEDNMLIPSDCPSDE